MQVIQQPQLELASVRRIRESSMSEDESNDRSLVGSCIGNQVKSYGGSTTNGELLWSLLVDILKNLGYLFNSATLGHRLKRRISLSTILMTHQKFEVWWQNTQPEASVCILTKLLVSVFLGEKALAGFLQTIPQRGIIHQPGGLGMMHDDSVFTHNELLANDEVDTQICEDALKIFASDASTSYLSPADGTPMNQGVHCDASGSIAKTVTSSLGMGVFQPRTGGCFVGNSPVKDLFSQVGIQ